MIKNFKCYLKNKIAAVLIAGATGITCVGCTNKNSNVNDVTVYISEETNDFVPYEDYPFEYKVTKYDCNKYKGTKCYFGDSFKSYDIKCTPIEFKNYFSCTNCTWETIFKAVEESPFDEYHKKLLNNGLINLKNNNFNMDLTVLYYNLKKIKLKYVDFKDGIIMGTFDCFNHEIKLCNDIKDNDKYNNDKYNLVFLHEMLGHGMTDAYYDEMKVYCSIDQPVIIKDDNGNIAGNSLYGQAFTEAMAQIITVTALNKQLTKERISYYDLCMVQLLMLCEDNNCSIVDYANNGVNYLTDKMKENDINDPNGIIAVASYNLYNDVVEISSQDLMYSYFVNVVDNEYKKGSSFNQINQRVADDFYSFHDYVITHSDDCFIVNYDNDSINLTELYNDIGKYASVKNKRR